MGKGIIQKLGIVFVFVFLFGCPNIIDENISEDVFIVEYNSNTATGGVAPVDSTEYSYGEEIEISDNTGNLTRESFVFDCWNTKADGTGDDYIPGEEISITEDITLYAKWIANTYFTVTYNENTATDGTVPLDSTEYLSGETAVVLGNTENLVKTSFVFDCWNTKADGTGDDCLSGEEVILTEDITFYAKWIANTYFTITYNENTATDGMVPVDNNVYTSGELVPVLDNTERLVKTSFDFDGWNTEADGTGDNYIAGEEITITEDITLYAEWISNTYFTVTYNENTATDGMVPVDNKVYTSGEIVVVFDNTENLVKTSFDFDGWNTNADGTGESYIAGEDITITEDIILYAEWIANTYFTVTYNENTATDGMVPVDNNVYTSGEFVPVLNNTESLVKTSFDFDGWNTKADGTGESYIAGEEITITEDITLYAEWIANTYFTVTYNENTATDGMVPVDTAVYESGESVIILGNTGSLIKASSTYKGWNTNADGTGTDYDVDAQLTITGNVTLYAKWIADSGIHATISIPEGDTVSLPDTLTVVKGSPFSITVQESFSTYKWYLDGTEQSGEISQSITISTDTLAADVYELLVIVTSSTGKTSSGRCHFSVTN